MKGNISMAAFKRTVVACAVTLLISCSNDSINENEKQSNYHATNYSLTHNSPGEDEKQKIIDWITKARKLGDFVPNQSMNPIFDHRGASSLTRSTAAIVMQIDTLLRVQRTAYYFGDTLIINDAIAKSGTSREKSTPGSEHFSGRAVDISTRGMTDQEKIKLVESALKAGFTGFGFGRTILHVDTGPNRWWAYGNSTYGGLSVSELGARVK